MRKEERMTRDERERDLKMIRNILSGKIENYTGKTEEELRKYYDKLLEEREDDEKEV